MKVLRARLKACLNAMAINVLCKSPTLNGNTDIQLFEHYDIIVWKCTTESYPISPRDCHIIHVSYSTELIQTFSSAMRSL